MSPRILADIQRRRLDRPFDRLPIVANSCNYELRFDAWEMFDSGYSVKLCLLTMYLLNGEILRTDTRHQKAARGNGHLQLHAVHFFQQIRPSATEKHLSYLKACRPQKVSLHHAGLSTKGYLWAITSTLLPSAWPCPRTNRKRHRFGLRNPQRNCLSQLAGFLRMSGKECLACEIQEYLVIDMIYRKPTPAKKHMGIMAGSVVEATHAPDD